jgi:hypothetical protein
MGTDLKLLYKMMLNGWAEYEPVMAYSKETPYGVEVIVIWKDRGTVRDNLKRGEFDLFNL